MNKSTLITAIALALSVSLTGCFEKSGVSIAQRVSYNAGICDGYLSEMNSTLSNSYRHIRKNWTDQKELLVSKEKESMQSIYASTYEKGINHGKQDIYKALANEPEALKYIIVRDIFVLNCVDNYSLAFE